MIIAPSDASSPSELRDATFAGEVWATPVLPTTDDVTTASIFFAPCSRTHWHSHERGQILHVVSGSGLVCTWGEEPRPIRAGDTVWVPPGEVHWHGGTRDSAMSHLAISLGTTSWREPVEDDVYGQESTR